MSHFLVCKWVIFFQAEFFFLNRILLIVIVKDFKICYKMQLKQAANKFSNRQV